STRTNEAGLGLYRARRQQNLLGSLQQRSRPAEAGLQQAECSVPASLLDQKSKRAARWSSWISVERLRRTDLSIGSFVPFKIIRGCSMGRTIQPGLKLA